MCILLSWILIFKQGYTDRIVDSNVSNPICMDPNMNLFRIQNQISYPLNLFGQPFATLLTSHDLEQFFSVKGQLNLTSSDSFGYLPILQQTAQDCHSFMLILTQSEQTSDMEPISPYRLQQLEHKTQLSSKKGGVLFPWTFKFGSTISSNVDPNWLIIKVLNMQWSNPIFIKDTRAFYHNH